MKRLKVLALALAVLAGVGLNQASGAPMFSVLPRSLIGNVGSHFRMLTCLTGDGSGVYGWQWYMNWDSTVLRCDSIKQGNFLHRGVYTTYFGATPSPLPAHAYETLIGGEPSNHGSGDLDTLFFTVRSAGSCSLRFNPANCILGDSAGNQIPSTAQNGFFGTPSGVEEGVPRTMPGEKRFVATPNPFSAFTSIAGHEGETFVLYDLSGRRVETYRGNRIGEGLKAGVYLLKLEGRDAEFLRLVKVR